MLMWYMKWSMQDTMIKQIINAIKKVFRTIGKFVIQGYTSVYKWYATKDLTNFDQGTKLGQVKKLRLVLN